MTIRMINVFAVPESQVDELLKRSNEITRVYARTSGFVETHPHRNAGVGNQTFNFINIALWASNEAFVQAHRDFIPGEENIPGPSFHPAVFEEMIMIRNLITAHSSGDE